MVAALDYIDTIFFKFAQFASSPVRQPPLTTFF